MMEKFTIHTKLTCGRIKRVAGIRRIHHYTICLYESMHRKSVNNYIMECMMYSTSICIRFELSIWILLFKTSLSKINKSNNLKSYFLFQRYNVHLA